MSTAKASLALTALLILIASQAPSAASAAVTDVFAGDVPCADQTEQGGVRLCSGPTTTWDGQTKIDVNVILPPEPAEGADGPYPLIGVFHGWGGSKIGLNADTRAWAEDGYAIFSMSDRGWGNSCGAADPDRIAAAATSCAEGYNHLMDSRYEVRDAQHLLSVLADEGLAQPRRIGATGASYGGGISMALAALRDRVMLPDGSLVPWTSPAGTPMEIAAAVPQWPWTDLAYALMPNGATLDYVADAPYLGPEGRAPIGVMKSSYVTGLFALGQALSNYAAAGTDPDADLVTWYGLVTAGEPYDTNPLAADLVEETTSHHSSYYIDHSREPAPLLIQSGWNDDLFPVDEAIRFYNRTRTEHPDSPISLFLSDEGHMRSQNKPADVAAFKVRRDAWFDHYLKGAEPAPERRVEALTTRCGGESEGPYAAPTWSDLAPGEIHLDDEAAQTIAPLAGDPTIGIAFDPIGGAGACATASGTDQTGAASYRLDPAPDPGFTLIGSPTVVADIAVSTPHASLAARLLDVAPDATQTLVTRGLLRPGAGGAGVVFQLHPQAYRFAPGHVAKLELLPSDFPYSRPSNLQTPITVSNLELRLPVLEMPGALGGLVEAPAPKVVPPGYRLARDFVAADTAGEEDEGEQKAGRLEPDGPAAPEGRPREPAAASSTQPSAGGIRLAPGRLAAARRWLRVALHCVGTGPCAGGLHVSVPRPGGRLTLARGPYSLEAGERRRLAVRLTAAGRRLITRSPGGAGQLRARVRLTAVVGTAPSARTRALRIGQRFAPVAD